MTKKLIIVDGSWYLFRAYYGLPALTDAQGRQTHAIYWFLRMLFRVFHEKPDYFLLAWDSPHKTIRHEQFEDYKWQRPELPDDFKWQIRTTKEVIDEIHINYQEIPWYEADDIIATMAKKWAAAGCDVEIMTSDKDMKALISDRITCIDPMKWLKHTYEAFTQERWFEPQYMIDYLSIIGDASDNIPWVKGIGPKGAIGLIQTYKTLEQVYENLDKITPAWLQEKLRENKDIAFESKSLVQLMDVPSVQEKPLEEFATQFNFSHMRDILIKKYQFNSMEKNIRELQDIYEKPQQMWLFG